MQHGIYQWEFEKDWYNAIQKVKTLPADEDERAAAFFPISIKRIRKLEKET